MTQILAVRHAPTKLNKEAKIIGHKDPVISKKRDVNKLANKLSRYKIDKIYSSDLKRAKGTAKILSKKFGAPIKYSRRLREVNYGRLSGEKKAIIRKKYPKYHIDAEFVHPGGESFNQLQHRVKIFVKSISDTDEKALIVTHAGCLRALYSICKKENIQKNINLDVKHESVLKCDIKKKFASLDD